MTIYETTSKVWQGLGALQDELVDQILANYDKLSDDLRAELPLKRIWTVAEEVEPVGED